MTIPGRDDPLRRAADRSPGARPGRSRRARAARRPSEDIETVAARRAKKEPARRLRWPLPGLPTVILALHRDQPALIGWRAEIVRWVPQTASLYAAIGLPVNLRGLVFADVTTETETSEGVQVLVVQGTIVSLSAQAHRRGAAPAIRGPQRKRQRNLQLDGAAEPQPAAGRRDPARSIRGWPRRRPRAATCWCASSTVTTSASASNEDEMARILIAEDEEASAAWWRAPCAGRPRGHDRQRRRRGARCADARATAPSSCC